MHGRSGLGLDGKPEHARKAHAAQDAQRVFVEARVGVSHRAQHAPRQVVLAAVQIDDAGLGAVGHGVDREVASGEVAVDVLEQLDRVGVAPVRIRAVRAKRRGLERLVIDAHRHRAVFDARRKRGEPDVCHDLLDLRGAGRRRDVPVVGSAPHDRVAHAAAHDERLEARGLEQVDDVLCLMWNLNLVHGAIVARRRVRGPDVAQAAESDKPRQTLDVGHVPAVLGEGTPAVPGGIARLELEHVVAVVHLDGLFRLVAHLVHRAMAAGAVGSEHVLVAAFALVGQLGMARDHARELVGEHHRVVFWVAHLDELPRVVDQVDQVEEVDLELRASRRPLRPSSCRCGGTSRLSRRLRRAPSSCPRSRRRRTCRSSRRRTGSCRPCQATSSRCQNRPAGPSRPYRGSARAGKCRYPASSRLMIPSLRS